MQYGSYERRTMWTGSPHFELHCRLRHETNLMVWKKPCSDRCVHIIISGDEYPEWICSWSHEDQRDWRGDERYLPQRASEPWLKPRPPRSGRRCRRSLLSCCPSPPPGTWSLFSSAVKERCQGTTWGLNVGKIMDLSCVCKSQGSSQMQHHWDNKLSHLYSLSWSPTICIIQHVFYKSKSSIWCCCLIWGVDVIVCVLV